LTLIKENQKLARDGYLSSRLNDYDLPAAQRSRVAAPQQPFNQRDYRSSISFRGSWVEIETSARSIAWFYRERSLFVAMFEANLEPASSKTKYRAHPLPEFSRGIFVLSNAILLYVAKLHADHALSQWRAPGERHQRAIVPVGSGTSSRTSVSEDLKTADSTTLPE
jgi:hypothetical protein